MLVAHVAGREGMCSQRSVSLYVWPDSQASGPGCSLLLVYRHSENCDWMWGYFLFAWLLRRCASLHVLMKLGFVLRELVADNQCKRYIVQCYEWGQPGVLWESWKLQFGMGILQVGHRDRTGSVCCPVEGCRLHLLYLVVWKSHRCSMYKVLLDVMEAAEVSEQYCVQDRITRLLCEIHAGAFTFALSDSDTDYRALSKFERFHQARTGKRFCVSIFCIGFC